jgi:hypothetical protein
VAKLTTELKRAAVSAQELPADGEVTQRIASRVRAMRAVMSTRRQAQGGEEARWTAARANIDLAVSHLRAISEEHTTSRPAIEGVIGQLDAILDHGRRGMERNQRLIEAEERALQAVDRALDS